MPEPSNPAAWKILKVVVAVQYGSMALAYAVIVSVVRLSLSGVASGILFGIFIILSVLFFPLSSRIARLILKPERKAGVLPPVSAPQSIRRFAAGLVRAAFGEAGMMMGVAQFLLTADGFKGRILKVLGLAHAAVTFQWIHPLESGA